MARSASSTQVWYSPVSTKESYKTNVKDWPTKESNSPNNNGGSADAKMKSWTRTKWEIWDTQESNSLKKLRKA
jgi:hypothetical protein